MICDEPGRPMAGPKLPTDDPGCGVQGEIADGDERGALVRSSSHQGPEPGQKLRIGEWLGQIIVRSDVEPANPIAHRVASGEHQDRGP